VNDISLLAPNTHFDELLRKFNSFHSRLKFIIEIGGEVLNFLELTLINRAITNF